MAQRKRNETISIRVYKKEKDEIQRKAKKTKQSVTSLILNAVNEAVIATPEEVQEWKKIDNRLDDIYLMFQDIADEYDTGDKTDAEIYEAIITQGKEMEEVWRCLKSLIRSQKTIKD